MIMAQCMCERERGSTCSSSKHLLHLLGALLQLDQWGALPHASTAIGGSTPVFPPNPEGRFPNCKWQNIVRLPELAKGNSAFNTLHIICLRTGDSPFQWNGPPYLITLHKGFHQIIICHMLVITRTSQMLGNSRIFDSKL